MRQLYVTKLCESCVCDKLCVCVTELYVTELYVTKLYGRRLCVTKLSV